MNLKRFFWNEKGTRWEFNSFILRLMLTGVVCKVLIFGLLFMFAQLMETLEKTYVIPDWVHQYPDLIVGGAYLIGGAAGIGIFILTGKPLAEKKKQA
jgi:hypothetical protein